MLSLTAAATCKQCQRNACRLKRTNITSCNVSWMNRLRGHSKRQFVTMNRNRLDNSATYSKAHMRHWNTPHYIPIAQSISTTTPNRDSGKEDYSYDSVLSAALDQSNAVIAQSLTENTFKLLRQGSPESAWDCYQDLASQHIQKYISRDQYNRLVRSFYRQNNSALGLESVLTLVEDMKLLGYQVGRRERLLVMKLLGQNGKLKEMERVFEDLRNDNLLIVPDESETRKAFNIMMGAYEERKKSIGYEVAAENMMRIYGYMLEHRVRPANTATTTLLDAIRKAGYSDDMVEKVCAWIQPKIAADVDMMELDPVIYQSLVFYFSNAGRPDYALSINDFMANRNIPRTLPMMTALIHKVGRAGNTNKAMELLDEMVHKEGIEPSIVTFNALIDVHAHKKPEPDVEGANRAYDMLREAGLNPDIYTFATLIDMFAKKGDLPMLRRVYRYMCRRKNIRPNDYIASSIVECFIRLGDMDSALQALKFLRGRGSKTTVVLDLIFKGYINNGKLSEAFSLLKAIDSSVGPSTKTFLPLLGYYANKGDSQSAHRIASLLIEANLPATSHVYAALLKSHAKARDIAGTERLFEAYKKRWGPDISIYNTLLYAYAKNNEMEKVFETYRLMNSVKVEPNEKTYGILMYFYSRRKDVQAVEAIMDTMTTNGILPGPICKTILMQTYFEAHRTSEARSIMDQMLQTGLEPSPYTWSILVNGCAKANELDFAESILQEAIERSKNSPLHQKNILRNVNVQYTRNIAPYETVVPQTIEDLLDTADESLMAGKSVLSSYLFSPLIDAYSKNGNFNRAKELFNKMVELHVPVTVPVYVTLMSMFQNEKRYDAVETMWQALHEPAKHQEFVENIDPNISRIPIPEKYYDHLQLLEITSEQNIQVIEPTEESIPEQASYFALSIYIDSLVQQDRGEEIETLWSQLESKNYQFDEQNWNRYIVSLLGNNKLDKACKIVSEQFLASDSVDEEDENEQDSRLSDKVERSRDKLDIDTSNQLHDRTCFAFATRFRIPGAENMGVLRLRSAVIERIKKFLREEQV
ncbi:hypothetical protein G6F46_001657 [Rhizopus delemar]|nr:hypothetical protein G6F55_003429 [Rhizopus delemar]KAG1552113.1 hypothetical protein G6F51_001425 [Rhizopus arrhizus]KAG1503937.1 hypothetical protein G6F54_001337 [Rhizopus delemar]KAG1512883.1 hypothetical protein G6F53_004848 [Rhizopus delemar]KAG1526249.1 hypothetical protein G6F52_002602 [Rhizopus delemar]